MLNVLSRKVIQVGGAAVIISAVAIYFGLFLLINASMDNADRLNAENEAERAYNALMHNVKIIDSICSDWAEWDDTYNFILNPGSNYDYVESNLVDETFGTIGVNYIVYLDKSENVVFAKGYDFFNDEELQISDTLMSQLRLLAAKNDTDVKTGFFRVEDFIYAFSARPILRSNETGPYVGTLIFARVVDEAFLEEASEILGLEFSIEPRVSFFKVVEDGENFTVFYPLQDYNGQQIGILKLQHERTALNVFRNFYLPFAFAGILIGATVVLSFVFFVKLHVTDRIERLASSLNEIRTGNWSGRVRVEGNDEITVLEKRINELLEEVTKRIEEVEELNESLKLVNRIMRHDILNDLTAIRLYAEILKEKQDERAIQRIEEAVSRITELIERVRRLEEALKSEIELEEVNLKEIVEEIAEKYGVELKFEGEPYIMAGEHIKFVFDNLISNSVKHGNAKSVFVQSSESNDTYRIILSDDGRGVDEAIASKIFEEGFSTGGSGIGLYIVKKLIERYGGKIELIKTKPVTFEITIPKEKVY